MKKTSKTILAGAVLAAGIAAGPAAAQVMDRVEVGVMDCIVEGGTGYIFGSTKDVSCTYRDADGTTEEQYFGAINKFGIDIGTTDVSYMTWAVFAPKSDEFSPGALEGNYFGISAEATAGAGLGANALVGGFDKSIALQPLSVSGQTGLNFALAVSELELRSASE